jgi:hypothetical protein
MHDSHCRMFLVAGVAPQRPVMRASGHSVTGQGKHVAHAFQAFARSRFESGTTTWHCYSLVRIALGRFARVMGRVRPWRLAI